MVLDAWSQNYQRLPKTREVEASEFQHLDLDFYQAAEATLVALGFTKLTDYEIVNLGPHARASCERTLIRGMVSKDGAIMATFFDLRKAGQAKLFSKMKLGCIVEFQTELRNGHWTTTNTAPILRHLKRAPENRLHSYPAETPIEKLLEHHRAHVQAQQATTGAKPRRIATAQAFFASRRRGGRVTLAFRRKIGWITKGEFYALNPDTPEANDRVWREILKLRREERARAKP